MTASSQLDTRHSLTLAALELMAERGLDAVSMRTINQAAGTRNASAVHYYFGNREGMLRAITTFIASELDTWRADALAELEHRTEPPTNAEVLWAAFRPYAKLYSERPYGRNALRFLARVQHERPAARAFSERTEGPGAIHPRLVALLQRANPTWEEGLASGRYFLFWTLMVQGFAIDQNIDHEQRDTRQATLAFFDFLLGGVEAPVGRRTDRG